MKIKYLLLFSILCSGACSKRIESDSQKQNEIQSDVSSCYCNDTIVQPEIITVEIDSNANPKQDFANAIKKGDCRFVGIGGFTLSVPGVDSAYRYHKIMYGYKMIKGTGDYVPKEDSRIFNFDPVEYAKEYNNLLKEYLSENCKSILESL